ncbi:hypothetical protein [Chitinophaga filiformis]|uniref:Uncharacterized protein n=1 Tax=Chitinophaga filiformis TaxID=104663 RepID=A0A1G8CGJ8_CHIFI|nr:hypothetical protein [Chitinophaga filiformis]SDH44596.1 hypothetical protein SAMN04488121_112137 [Chitinophaga filiformis]
MGNNNYYRLDEIGFIGVQEERFPASKKYHDNRTARIFKAAKAVKSAKSKKTLKKV